MACLKRLKWLFIPVFAILLMSHNTYAALSIPVRLVNGNYDASILMGGNTNPNCVFVPSNHSFAQNSCSDLDIIAQNFQVNFNSGTYLNTYIVDIPLYFTLNTNNNALDAWLRNLTLSVSDNNHWSIIDVDFQMLSTSSGLAHVYLKSYGSPHSDNSVTFSSNGNYILSLHPGEVLGVGNTSVWEIVDTTVDTQSIVNAIENQTPAPSAQDIADSINDGQSDATQDAADNASDAGSSSAASAEGATSSLISVIGGFVGVLTSASPSNCLLNANMNHIDMGQIDLCANPVPSYIQIIGSIILICAAIPLAIVLFNRFIGLFRSFQG